MSSIYVLTMQAHIYYIIGAIQAIHNKVPVKQILPKMLGFN